LLCAVCGSFSGDCSATRVAIFDRISVTSSRRISQSLLLKLCQDLLAFCLLAHHCKDHAPNAAWSRSNLAIFKSLAVSLWTAKEHASGKNVFQRFVFVRDSRADDSGGQTELSSLCALPYPP